MKDIKDLKKDLTDGSMEIREQAVEKLVQMAAEGNVEASKVLYEVLKTETKISVLQKVFEIPIRSKEDKRYYFFNEYELYILPLIKEGKLSGVKDYVIKRAKEVAELESAGTKTIEGAISVLAELIGEDKLFAFIDSLLRGIVRDYLSDLLDPLYTHPSVLEKIFERIEQHPDAYSNNFVKIFNWFLENPHPSISEKLGKLWVSLPSNFKEAIRLYYYKEMERFYLYYYKEMERFYKYIEDRDNKIRTPISFPQKHPLLQWLEEFERGVFTSSLSSLSALQAIAEKIGFYLKDDVKEIETEEPSPITIQRRKQEIRRENVELIPIDKFLGEYFPQDQLIKLYMNEIRTIAKRLNVRIEVLKRVVELHEAAHAVVHLGRDANGRNFNTGAFNMVDSGSDPSPLHETLAQLLSYHSLKDIPELRECFEKLNQHQPREYTLWKNFKDVNLERVRGILVGMREGRVEASFEMFEKLILL